MHHHAISIGMALLAMGVFLASHVRAATNRGDTATSSQSTGSRTTTGRSHRLTGPAEAFERFFEDSWPPFRDTDHGSGRFGRWITDAAGDPAYAYTMDQTQDARAAYFTSAGSSRDHWHLIGNDRIAATAHNGGYVQLYDWTRGGKLLNRWCPAEHNFAGGFKFVQTPGGAFNTLWSLRPPGATQRRVFGVGYFEKTTRHQDLTITERIEAPPGDDPVLLSRTIVENHCSTPVDVSIVEFWDVNLHQLTPALIMTKNAGNVAQRRRAGLNRRFVMDAQWDGAVGALQVHLAAADPKSAPGPNDVAQVDYHPKTVFLAALDPLPDGFGGYAVDQDRFFGPDGIAKADSPPPGVSGAADGQLFERRLAYGGKAVLALRRTIHLAPGRPITLRYLYGYADKTRIGQLVARYRRRSEPVRRPALELAVPDLPWLGRELLWHSYYLQAGAFYQDFYRAHFVDQGSAYAYLQGGTGAHRDFALFTLPMVYLRPDLAKEMLRFSMASQDPSHGGLPYVHAGYGFISGALVHSKSSDLDLFFLWALSEYLAATQDRAFLAEKAPYYPPHAGVSGTVLDHARAAFRHLTKTVGVGPHGLIRCGTGDWNDVLIAQSPKPMVTMRKGESSLNAGLATVALPAMADVVVHEDASFAAELRKFAAAQARALKSLWTGKWAARGYLGEGDTKLGVDRIYLDTQSFGVLGGVWERSQMQTLFEQIQSKCVTPQPAGALCLWPPIRGPFLELGSDTNGGTWAAVDSWVAWAWSRLNPAAAWDFYLTTTLAARATAYPYVWYGVWSGPDSYNAHYHDRPGETFNVNFTPMTDFPVMNMNRHAGPLTDAIKLAGIQPRGERIVIDPRLPFDTFAIRLPLVGAAYLLDRHRGYYAPVAPGTFRFAIRPPARVPPKKATLHLNGRNAACTVDDDGRICFESAGTPGRRIVWEIR